jgi:MFS family permease
MNVIPQLLLALCSPAWGRLLDRIGIMRCRLLISVLLSVSLLSHYGGLLSGMAFLIYFGSIVQGLSNGGGQLTWYLASSLLAPRTEDVPLYNGIHFVLNGVRGLALPWVGTQLFLVSGTGSVFVAVLFSLAGIPILLRALNLKDDRLAGRPLWLRKAAPRPSPERPAAPEPSPAPLSRTA